MKNTVKIWLGPLFHLFFPRCCVVCGAPLVEGEEAICTHCNINMPRTNYHKVTLWSVYSGERFLWNVPLLISSIAKGVTFARYCISSSMEDEKNWVQ